MANRLPPERVRQQLDYDDRVLAAIESLERASLGQLCKRLGTTDEKAVSRSLQRLRTTGVIVYMGARPRIGKRAGWALDREFEAAGASVAAGLAGLPFRVVTAGGCTKCQKSLDVPEEAGRLLFCRACSEEANQHGG